MHLLEAWTTLGPFHLARLLALPGAILVASLLPGRVLARGTAIVCALAVGLLDELAVPWWARGTWVVLWLVIAWQAGMPERADLLPSPPRRRGFEAGAVALPLGIALLSLMLAAVWRQTFEADVARRAARGPRAPASHDAPARAARRTRARLAGRGAGTPHRLGARGRCRARG